MYSDSINLHTFKYRIFFPQTNCLFILYLSDGYKVQSEEFEIECKRRMEGAIKISR